MANSKTEWPNCTQPNCTQKNETEPKPNVFGSDLRRDIAKLNGTKLNRIIAYVVRK